MPQDNKTTAKELAIKIGNAVRSVRLEAGLSQDELAWRAGIHRAYMGVIERGEQSITVFKLYQIAEALDMRPSDILERADS